MSDRYPLAPNGIYRTYQGEGPMLGIPMVFVRLAGCSLGCPLCDTDYRVDRRATTQAIAMEVRAVAKGARWAWVTGGEPTDHDLIPLAVALKEAGFQIALATSGVRNISLHWNFVTVSPHYPDWALRCGDVLNLVPGLNGYSLDDLASSLDAEAEDGFTFRYVTPCDGKPETLAECLMWLERRPHWWLGCQAQKTWGLP